jgi:hypothetical protein
MNHLKTFKKINRNDKQKLIKAYYSDKSFRMLLKNTGLGGFARILNAVGSYNPVVTELLVSNHPQFLWQGNDSLSTFTFDVFLLLNF